MPVAPPTPFLPTFKYGEHDQSLLIDTEPTFDESFDAWPVSPRVTRPNVLDKGSESRCETTSLGGGASEEERIHDKAEARLLAKRAGGDSPLKSHIQKKVRPPTPVRDDFYTRRVKDSDRRSSLGARESGTHAAVFPSLARSTSRGSAQSAASSSSADPFWSAKAFADLAERENISSAPSSPESMAPPPQPHPPQAGHTSPSPPYPTTARSSSPPSVAHQHSLHRAVSRLSTSSSSRRTSFSGKVAGFFSNLIRRRSSNGFGEGHAEGEAHSGVQALPVREDGRERTPEESEIEEDGEARAVHGTARDEPSALESRRIVVPMGNPGTNAPPRLRLPPTLTRPAPRSLSTAGRALQPKKTVPGNLPPPIASSSKSIAGSKLHPKPTSALNRTANPPLAKSTSSFAARALSRLPAPGKGSTSSSRPITIRTTERASDIASKRETFERLAREAAEERARLLAKFSAPPQRPTGGLKKTVPVKGNTPGKASRQRAEERARFEQDLRERHEEKRKRDEELQRAREEMEQAEDRAVREERVVWAKGLPQMYTRRRGAG